MKGLKVTPPIPRFDWERNKKIACTYFLARNCEEGGIISKMATFTTPERSTRGKLLGIGILNGFHFPRRTVELNFFRAQKNVVFPPRGLNGILASRKAIYIYGMCLCSEGSFNRKKALKPPLVRIHFYAPRLVIPFTFIGPIKVCWWAFALWKILLNISWQKRSQMNRMLDLYIRTKKGKIRRTQRWSNIWSSYPWEWNAIAASVLCIY